MSRFRSLSAVGLLSPLLLLACIPDGSSPDPTSDAGLEGDGGTEPSGDGGVSDAGPVVLSKLATDMLEAHNAARASAQPTPSPALNPLNWDPSVAEVAQGWADRCDFSHNPNRGNAGENIAAATPDHWDAKAAVKDWVDEKASYDYAKNSCAANKVCGHYTQVVWRNTARLGCAMKRCTTNSPFGTASGGAWDFFVCNYAPPGNFTGQRPY